MSAKLPVVSPKDAARIAERLGFAFRRQRGSHAIYVRESDQPRAKTQDLACNYLFQDPKVSIEEFHETW